MEDLKWQERYVWYDLGYKEVYDYSEEDFERDAAKYKEKRITAVILHKGTHFIFALEPYWEDIFACIEKIVRAFHKFGIKVIEHRSYSLAGRVDNEKDWMITRWFHPWPGMKERVFSDYTVRGVNITSMAQVDGRTGLPMLTVYRSYCLCPNNPDYKKLIQYIAGRMFDLGVDGMMNDDIEYHNNACACEHCRRLFKEETGYDLPTPENWDSFYENYENEVYIRWKEFKVRSTARCLDEIVALERAKGLPKLIRPVYACMLLPRNFRNSVYEMGLKHYTNYFQENLAGAVVRYTYPYWMAESLDRYARAERFGIPSMSLFYTDTIPSVYFSWALSHTWGQMYTGALSGASGYCIEDMELSTIECPYREFEYSYSEWLGESKKYADLAVYQSLLTREGCPAGSTNPMINLITAANFSGLTTDMVFDDDSVEKLLQYPVIALNCTLMMTDENIAKLRAYAEGGGTLLIIGNCGAYNEKIQKRTPAEIAMKFGLSTKVIPCDSKKEGIFEYDGQVVYYDDMRTTCCFDSADGILKSGNVVLGVEEAIGKGKILCLLPQLDACEIDSFPLIHFDKKGTDTPLPIVTPSTIPKLRTTTGKLLRAIVREPKINVKCSSDDLLVTMYKVTPGYVIHITNITDTFALEQKEAWHEDPLLGFDGGHLIADAIDISVVYEEDTVPCVTVQTPERECRLGLDVKVLEGHLSFTIPQNFFGGYAMVTIEI